MAIQHQPKNSVEIYPNHNNAIINPFFKVSPKNEVPATVFNPFKSTSSGKSPV
jgi:hypothetical protein